MCELHVVLASASPRRRQLLQQVGIACIVDPADICEASIQRKHPDTLAKTLAEEKALTVSRRHTQGYIVGADTFITVDGAVLNKPGDEQEAFAMLRQLSGRTHQVVSGVAVVDAAAGQLVSDTAVTHVTFRQLDDEHITRYIATGEPFDKAGAYGIQERGALFVSHIQGCYPNVVGLPLATLVRLFAKLGVDILPCPAK